LYVSDDIRVNDDIRVRLVGICAVVGISDNIWCGILYRWVQTTVRMEVVNNY
jgi:hypothetical protein